MCALSSFLFTSSVLAEANSELQASTDLVVLFTIKGGEVPETVITDEQEQADDTSLIDGQVYKLNEIDTILNNQSNASGLENSAGPLFKNAVLSLQFMDISSEFAKDFDLAQCATIEYLPSEDLANQSVKCDEAIYSIAVGQSSLNIMRDEEIDLTIELGTDTFRLNNQTYSASRL